MHCIAKDKVEQEELKTAAKYISSNSRINYRNSLCWNYIKESEMHHAEGASETIKEYSTGGNDTALSATHLAEFL